MCEEHGGRPAVERVRERNAAVGALPSRLRLGCDWGARRRSAPALPQMACPGVCGSVGVSTGFSSAVVANYCSCSARADSVPATLRTQGLVENHVPHDFICFCFCGAFLLGPTAPPGSGLRPLQGASEMREAGRGKSEPRASALRVHRALDFTTRTSKNKQPFGHSDKIAAGRHTASVLDF